MLQMMAQTLKPLQVDESTLALDAIVEGGPWRTLLRHQPYHG